ncbi:glutathione synthase [Ascodesmis nigricans]|uniref:Glutathione synthetase n=1 Tax=Ascodesmis nigricans TaxID=341454 RepID=A0A4S2N731_9PEZI|nr:glutathione synthase [Ascodesmis nigricans]
MYSPKYPPTTDKAQFNHLLSTCKDWCLSHGLTVRPPPSFSENPHEALTTHAPVSLYPSLFPRSSFDEARAVQTAYNELYARVSDDTEFLDALTADIAQVDDFIANLHSIQTKIASTEGFAHEFSLGLFRSDYMLHDSGDGTRPIVQQVEFNTIASSFGGLASQVAELHRFLLKSGAYPEDPYLTYSHIPDNPAASGLASGLASAHHAYGPTAIDGIKTAVLFIVQPNERNAFDQHWISYSLLKLGIRSYRCTLTDVPTTCKIDETRNRRLLFHPPHLQAPIEISTIYFRSGYSPDDYPTPAEWSARHLLERSKAIKCPTIATQLAGAKKVQQVLAVDGMLERFLSHTPNKIAAIRGTFAGIHPLDTSPLGLQARKMAFENPERYVLKPQREGGGNNVYREKIPAFLREIGEEKWAGYILMELIKTPVAKGVILRNGEAVEGWVVSELGVYGTILWDREGNVVKNQEAGWLLRTKGRESDEGGVAAGFGCVDGVCLVD